MGGSALRYLERQTQTKRSAQTEIQFSDDPIRETITKFAQNEDLLRRQMEPEEFQKLLRRKEQLELFQAGFKGPETEAQLRLLLGFHGKLLPLLLIFLAFVLPQFSGFWLGAILPSLLLNRLGRWISLRREHHKELYPTRTLIGALFIPGWFKRNSY